MHALVRARRRSHSVAADGATRSPATCGPRVSAYVGADQAADHRAAAGHHAAHHGRGGPRACPSVVADGRHPGRRDAGRRRGQRHQHVRRPRHRRADEPHREPPAGDRRGHADGRADLRRRPRGRWPSSSSGRCVNLLSAVLAVSATLFYVFVYTLWLKRTSTQNIVIGGAAGAVPVLVGWAAVTNSPRLGPARAVRHHLRLDAAALLGAGHQVPGRLRGGRRADAAGGRVASPTPPARSSSTPCCCGLPRSCSRRSAGMGLLYSVSARRPRRRLPRATPCELRRTASPVQAMRLFTYSISYVTLLFAAMAVDQLVRH